MVKKACGRPGFSIFAEWNVRLYNLVNKWNAHRFLNICVSLYASYNNKKKKTLASVAARILCKDLAIISIFINLSIILISQFCILELIRQQI